MTNLIVDEFKQRCQQVLETAKQLHSTKPDWVTFFREILGLEGVARSTFALQGEFLQFEQTKEHEEIKAMVSNLRNKKPKKAQEEDTKVITVRLPESLHEALKAEAAEHRTSMNKLCITKLLQALIDENNANNAASAASAASASNSQPETQNVYGRNGSPDPASRTGFSMDRQPADPGFRSTFQDRNFKD